MIVEVTKHDIRHRISGSADSCPVSRAVNRATGGYALTYQDQIFWETKVKDRWGINWERKQISSPPEVADFICKFDAPGWIKGHPRPFIFELPD